MRFLISCFICLYSALSAAQVPVNSNIENLIPGKLLFKWKEGRSFTEISEKMPAGSGRMYLLDAGFRLGEMECDAHRTAEIRALIARQDWCSYVQYSHKVMRRKLPDDPQISSQKHLQIIKAEYAWNYATSKGVNTKGDTMVVAVMDDGMDTSHPDIVQNLWINRAEIPWNGLDDDGNGYADDQYGWNGGDSNGRVVSAFAGDHGTAVAGIIGARGNNGIGITGINWLIKILPIVVYGKVNTGDESGMFRSFLYVLRNKQLYLNSNGSKGINVIVVNLSVGIDGAFPVDAPIWCEMIDSMGKAGILTVGATTNSNVDVEQAGDIPSTCPSKYLIMTGNTNANDNWVASGFSKKYIDLAAPGEASYSLVTSKPAGNGRYGPFSGTSAAAPLIAGTAAYLMSNACNTYWEVYKTNKDSANALVRSWILQGTDTLASLAGRYATDGRLNMYKSLLAMYRWCGKYEPVFGLNGLAQKSLSLFPVPAAAGSLVKFSVPFQFSGDIRICDMTGREFIRYKHSGMLENILCSNLTAGTYCLFLSEGGSHKSLIFQVF